ncbi:hypothetical protein K0I73_14525 [Shewanella mesophila]|uniref:hypothetical protein n=1 Tax=Shewanella mesophila TaxID=2864208 RepID=UPI001C65AD91|nr:hypothetical protein [Shewanella mesophila]QYJ85406.1 hypothetical protein K0I73_14525 [Shewanella mesophila]
MRCRGYLKYYNWDGNGTTKVIEGGFALIGDLVNTENRGGLYCNDEIYRDGHDTNGDGEIDRCYNPDDKLKNRENIDSWCIGYETLSLSTSDENTLKKAAEDLLVLLSNIDSDFSSPNLENSCRLNGLASLMGIPDYQHPNFKLLTDSMSRSLFGIKQRLEVAKNDLSGTDSGPRYIIMKDTDNARAIHCTNSQNFPFSEEDIAFDDNLVDNYGNNEDDDLKFLMTFMHEVHHSLGARHPKRTDDHSDYTVALYKKDFENEVSEINDNKGKSFATPAWFESEYQQLMRNPYHLAWAIGAVKCQ